MSVPSQQQIIIFGEVLFDCFSQNGHQECKLGGAPFNICWHMQAIGDNPIFISRVGNDELGDKIVNQAQQWGITVDNIQRDEKHATGVVQVSIIDDEPHYEIKTDSAYDFIQHDAVKIPSHNHASPSEKPIFYHGSLALRSDSAKQEFNQLVDQHDWDIFLDVNLRAPWWDKQNLVALIKQARWVKLNIDELRELGFTNPDLNQAMQELQQQFGNEQVIVTQGADGVSVLTPEGIICQKPELISDFVDTVGAGDAFTAIYMHGLIKKWPTKQALAIAQGFASKIIGIRGATPTDKDFYHSIVIQR